MIRRAALLLAATLLLLPMSAMSMDLIAPASECTLTEGRVRVIGLAPGAEKGSVEFKGQKTSFRIRDGQFSVALNLGPGAHEVLFSAGDQKLVAKWTVDPKAGSSAYEYHPELNDGECQACHEATKPPAPNTDISEICERCHDEMDDAKYVHGPVAMGLCTACHDPHGSVYPGFGWLGPEELCEDCHNQPITKTHRTNSNDGYCTDCHNPHGSAKKYQIEE